MRVLALLLVCTTVNHARANDNAVGRWEGLAQIPGRELTLIVDLAQSDDGQWNGALTIPGLNVKNAALTEIAINATDVSFAVRNALSATTVEGPKIQARFASDVTLSGDFTQAGNRAPITLHKVGLPDLESPRKSTAIAPELEGEWQGAYEFLGYERKVTLKLSNRAENGATAEFVIVGKKVNTLPVNLITQTGDFFTVDSQETGFSFEGRYKKDVIDGTVVQGPMEIPVKLTRPK